MVLIHRHLQQRASDALGVFRVVLIHGARQCGKSTLARTLTEQAGGLYVTLDDPRTLQSARRDPSAFFAILDWLLVVDEIQRGGDELIRTLKQIVDEDPRKGRFLLTGSSNFLTVPKLSESLAGRVGVLQLWPLSEAELNGTEPAAVLEDWFAGRFRGASDTPMERRDYFDLVCRGGYPEMLALEQNHRRDWVSSYVETVIQRDIADLADIRKSAALLPLLRWVAANTSSASNVSKLSKRLEMNRETVESYLGWLEMVFLIQYLPAWSRNTTTRALRRSKLHVTDTGVAAALLNTSPESLMQSDAVDTGRLLESFVVNELRRQISSSRSVRPEMYHYRDGDGREIDVVLEQPDGSVVAVEVKASSSPSPDEVRHLGWLRDKMDAVYPGAFRCGVLLHTGNQDLPMGDRLRLQPISALWR